MRFHMLDNVRIALRFLQCKNIKLVNIQAEDIVDGNPKLTLGLIWTIILHFQVCIRNLNFFHDNLIVRSLPYLVNSQFLWTIGMRKSYIFYYVTSKVFTGNKGKECTFSVSLSPAFQMGRYSGILEQISTGFNTQTGVCGKMIDFIDLFELVRQKFNYFF